MKKYFKAGASELNNVLQLMQQTNAFELAQQAAQQQEAAAPAEEIKEEVAAEEVEPWGRMRRRSKSSPIQNFIVTSAHPYVFELKRDW